jgi:hypothetical protein
VATVLREVPGTAGFFGCYELTLRVSRRSSARLRVRLPFLSSRPSSCFFLSHTFDALGVLLRWCRVSRIPSSSSCPVVSQMLSNHSAGESPKPWVTAVGGALGGMAYWIAFYPAGMCRVAPPVFPCTRACPSAWYAVPCAVVCCGACSLSLSLCVCVCVCVCLSLSVSLLSLSLTHTHTHSLPRARCAHVLRSWRAASQTLSSLRFRLAQRSTRTLAFGASSAPFIATEVRRHLQRCLPSLPVVQHTALCSPSRAQYSPLTLCLALPLVRPLHPRLRCVSVCARCDATLFDVSQATERCTLVPSRRSCGLSPETSWFSCASSTYPTCSVTCKAVKRFNVWSYI